MGHVERDIQKTNREKIIMKIFITTYYKYNNYGTRLQNYALQEALKSNSKNTKVQTIYLKNKKDFVKNYIKKFFSFLKSSWKNDTKKKYYFYNFNKKIKFIKTTNKKLSLLDTEESVFIAGSDQIWSPLHLKNNPQDSNLFFLNFVKKGQKNSYAPSFGVNELPKDMINFYKKNLKKFDNMSVREKTGQEILKSNFNIEAKVMPDPVFLLSQKEWSKIAKEPKQKKYALVYLLGEQNKDFTETIKKYCTNNNLKIITIAGNNIKNKETVVTPEEFIGLIKKADTVFTDSFHAC